MTVTSLILLCALPSADPSPATALQLPDVIASVNQHHPSIAAALADLDAARGELLAADGAFDPVVKGALGTTPLGEYTNHRADISVEQPTPIFGTSFFGGYRLGMGSFGPYDLKRETNALGELRAGVSVPLGRNGWTDRRRANMARASLGVAAGEQSVQAARVDHARLATHRYWAWVAAGSRLRAVKDLVAMAEERDAQLRARVARGDVPDLERVENERALLQRRGAQVSAERALVQAAIELSLFLRDSRGQPVVPDASRLPPGLPEPAEAVIPVRQELVKDALAVRPDVARLAVLQEQNRVELDLARNQLLPTVDVVLQGSQDMGPGKAGRRRPELEAWLTVEIPLPARTARGRLQSAEAATRRTAEQLRLQRDRVAAEIADAHTAMMAAQERISVVRGEVDVARKLEMMERKRFEVGEGTLLFVNLREMATVEAVLREVDAVVEYHRAAADLVAARGGAGRSGPS